MHKLNDYFDCVYLINLDGEEWKGRLRESENEFNKIGASFERFPAVNGWKENLPCAPYSKFDPFYWNSGAAGLVKTTSNIIKDAKEKKYRRILICEDDVEFAENFNERLTELKNIPSDWQMFMFGAQHVGSFDNVSPGIARVKYAFCLHCYAVNSNIFDYYEYLLDKKDSQGRFLKQLDLITAEDIQQMGKTYCFDPNSAFQRPSYSSIQKRNVDHNIFLKSTKVVW